MTETNGNRAAVWPSGPAPGLRRLWERQLPHYPDTRARTVYLGITVLATIVLYYELYVQGSVAPMIIREFGFTFTEFVFVGVIGNVAGAFASLAAGLADRWGRANLVVVGVLVTGLLIAFGLPNATDKATYTVLYALLSVVEGMALVATPALIRDFSPQVGRAVAMGFWALGPVLGSLVVTMVATNTLDTHPDWRFQFYVCGAVGLAVWLVALVGLRELAPRLRDQLMVTMRDRALIEARASGTDPEQALAGHWRQMLKFDVVGSALAISLFLLVYYMLVFFIVVYFQANFGYTEQKANSLANYFWATNAIALVTAGVLSDKLRVRKPFMIAGTLLSLAGLGLFAAAATDPGTRYETFALYFVLCAAGVGLTYVAWMASFTETVERRNPAATATGLAIWGWTIRITVCVALATFTLVVPATSTLVDKGPRVQQIVAAHPEQVEVLQTVDGATLAAPTRDPADAAAQAQAIAQLTGLTPEEVARVAALGAEHEQELATAAAIDPATLQAVAADPTDQQAAGRAVGEIAQKLEVPPVEAAARLRALGAVPPADLTFLQANGPTVEQAAARLRSVSEIPPADLAFLQANGARVAQAQKDNPGQWQTWWWVCFLGQVAFIPFVFLMAGRWSPRKARRDELEHERRVQLELARLAAATPREASELVISR